MGKIFRFGLTRASGWHPGGPRLLGGLLLVALLDFYPALATAGSGMPASVASDLVPDFSGAPSAEANGNIGAAAREPEEASAEVRYVVEWVAATGDNEGLPYIIVDKVDAKVYVFDAAGMLQGTAAALLGMAQGDGSADGVGDRALASMGTADRTTPAGRFVASLGADLHGQDILWVDYGTALALHRVGKGTPAERRAQRLESATSRDNRISYGCINVPVKFYEKVVGPAFRQSSGVVYILPEMSAARDLFKPGIARER